MRLQDLHLRGHVVGRRTQTDPRTLQRSTYRFNARASRWHDHSEQEIAVIDGYHGCRARGGFDPIDSAGFDDSDSLRVSYSFLSSNSPSSGFIPIFSASLCEHPLPFVVSRSDDSGYSIILVSPLSFHRCFSSYIPSLLPSRPLSFLDRISLFLHLPPSSMSPHHSSKAFLSHPFPIPNHHLYSREDEYEWV